jgi:glycosyltransferase involved in cell wall biosynthesis
VPATIVCCSEGTRRAHAVIGYDASRMMVIPYGFAGNAGIGRSDPSVALRLALGVNGHDVLVGRVGRFHAQKDYATMVKAAALVRASRPNVHFLLCGDRVTADNGQLAGWLRQAGSPGGIHLLGPRNDMATIYGALDLACSSSSFGEGLPNVIGEAMASSVPVVTTDVGDSAAMVGDTGRVVPPGNAQALASAIIGLTDAGAGHRRQLGDAAQRRAEHRYGLDRMAEAYQTLYEELVRTAAHERSKPARPARHG